MPTVNVPPRGSERTISVLESNGSYSVADVPTDVPLVEVEVGGGYSQVQLPNGFAYDEGETALLTLDQLDQIDVGLFDGGVLINNGFANGELQQEGTIVSMVVTGADADDSIAGAATNQYTATVTYASGETEAFDNTNSAAQGVVWASSDLAVATIDANGLATGVAAGTTSISATLRGVTASVTLTVT